jgi:hypothetical protein
MSFDALFAANVVLAIVALARLRGAMFIILANVCTVLRAFSTIATFGQPRSQGYIPPAVFDPSRLEAAETIFLIVTLVGIVAVLLPDRKQEAPAELPALPKWLVAGLLLYFLALGLSSKTILSGAYSDVSRENFEIPHGGETFLLQGLAVYELHRRVLIGRLNAVWAFVTLFAILVVTDYSKGSTGGAVGFIFTGAFLFFGHGGTKWSRFVKVSSVLVATVIFTLFVRGARASLYSEGTGAFASVWQQLVSSEETRTRSGEGLESNANGTQNATHVLECVYLYDSGYSREWRSLYNPLVYTFQPKFVMDVLGKERAIEPAWELTKYFQHGGGIATFGEMYWNGGHLCVGVVSSLMFLLAYLADTRRNRGFGWLVFYCMFASCLGYGVGYGLTYLFRGSTNALFVIIAYKLFRRASDTIPRGDSGIAGQGGVSLSSVARS